MAGAVKLGKNACIKKNDVVVGLMTSFTLNINQTFLDGTSFLDTYEKPVPVTQNWTGQIAGYHDPVGSTEQGALETAAKAGTKLTDLKFFIDDTYYYASNTAGDALAGVYIESYNTSAEKSGIITFTMSLKGRGPIKRF